MYNYKCMFLAQGLQKTFSSPLEMFYLRHLTNIKDFNVKSKPVLGGRMPLLNVTSYPGSIICAHCVSVTNLGFGFLIWLKDV